MKKLIALLLVLATLFSLAACGDKPGNKTDDPANPNGGSADASSEPTEVDDGICETAWEAAANMGLGWNLGCSLSVASKTTVSAFSGLIGMHTDDGLYSRSEYLTFNEETNSVTLDWDLGNDNGLLQTYEGALVGQLFVEQWNFALTEADYCTFTVDEFSYTLKSGETVSIEPVTQETDMSGGTGYIPLVDAEALNGLLVEDIATMHCVMSFGGLNAGEPTPEKIATQETAWGNPVTTQEMIDAVVERGFNTIRIQVSYLNHMDEEGNIDKLWLDRVQEVVDYCMNAGVYCVINTSGAMWMTCNPADWETQKPVYTNLWKQISERFADYGEKLIFESCNEVLYSEGLWNYPPMEAYDVMHQIHQTFVDTVRAGGGYNETRNLMLNPYAAGYEYDMNKHFTLPTDTVEGHLMAQVHCYVPQDFTFNETNLGSTNFRYEWGTDEDKQQLDDVLKGIKTRFIDELGIPVVIGEFGVAKRLSEGEAAEYMGFYAKTADKYGINLILFDDGVDISVFDRGLLIWMRPQVVEALFAKDAPAHEGGDEGMPAGIPEVEAVTDPMPSWYSRLYFTDSDGTYNTSVTAEFSNSTKKSKLLWVLGKNDTDLKAKDTADVMEIGMDLWNFTLTKKTPVDVEVLQLTYYTKNGAVNVPLDKSKMTIELNSGAGAAKLAELSGVKAGDIVAIYLEVKMIVEDNSGTSVSGLPSVSAPAKPYGDFQSVVYFATMQTGYNRSDPSVSFDADTKTAEVLYKLDESRANGFTTAGADELISGIGVEIWNFGENRPSKVDYSVLSLKYYTDDGSGLKMHTVPLERTDFTVKLSPMGNGGTQVATLMDSPVVGNVVAIYAKVRLNIADEPEPEPEPETPAGLPVVTPVTNPSTTSSRLYLATKQTGYNTSDYSAFDAETKQSEVLWMFNDGSVSATSEELLAVLGVEIADFTVKPAKQKVRIDELKYYTLGANNTAVAHDLPLLMPEWTYYLSAGQESKQSCTYSDDTGPKIGDIIAVYLKATLVDDQPDAPKPEGLPEITPPADPILTGTRLYLADPYTASAYTFASASTGIGEVLWMLNDGSMAAYADKPLADICLETTNYNEVLTHLNVQIEELKYYVAVDGGYQGVDIPVNANGQFVQDMTNYSGYANLGKPAEAVTIGQVAALYVKYKFVDEFTSKEPVVQLPEITPPADPGLTGTRLYLADPYTASAYTFASAATGVGEVLWMLNDGSMAAYADKPLADIWLETTNYNQVLTHLNVQVEELKYYVAVDGGYNEFAITVNNNGQFLQDMTTYSGYANMGKPAETVTIGQVAALYVKYKFVDEFETEAPVVQLPEITPPADPGLTGTRLYLADPYTASAYTFASAATGVGEVLWMLNDGSMAAYADKPLADIWLETTNYNQVLTHLNVQVEELKYYVAVDGGYNEFAITVNNNGQFLQDMTTYSGYANMGKPAETVTIGQVAALYVKYKFVDEFKTEAPVVQLPEITPPADPGLTGTRLYLADPYTVSAYTFASAATGVGEVLWMLNDGSMAAYADKPLADIWLETTNYNQVLTHLNVQVEELKYYVAVDGGYNEFVITVNNNGQFVQDMTTYSGYANMGKPAETVTIGQVAALYVKYKFVDDFTSKHVAKLPEVSAPGSQLPGYCVMPYFATMSAGFNRMDPHAVFDAGTNTAKALFVLEDCRTAGFVTAKEDESILGIGMNFWNFADTSASFSYTVKELKYYTADGQGYLEHTLKLDTADFELTLAGGTGANTVLLLEAGTMIVGDVVAIYAEIQMNLPQVKSIAAGLRDVAVPVGTPNTAMEPEEE